MYPRALLTLALVSLSTQSLAVYPDLDAMLQAFRPNAASTPEINGLIQALDDLAPYPAARQAALLSLVPFADGSLWAASDMAQQQVLSSIFDRLVIVKRAAEASMSTGVAAGDEEAEGAEDEESCPPEPERPVQDLSEATEIRGTWIIGLGDVARQKTRKGLPGYKAEGAGVLFGTDWSINPQLVLGVGAGLQHVNVHSRGPSGSTLAIERVEGLIYGRYDWPQSPAFYTQGALILAVNEYDSRRTLLVLPVAGRGLFRQADADFRAQEVDAYLEGGYRWQCEALSITPKILVNYAHLAPRAYREHGASGLDLAVSYRSLDAFSLGMGAKLAYRHEFEKAYIIPEMHVYGFHDFVHDAQRSVAHLIEGAALFLTEGPMPASNSIDIGASLNAHSYRNTLVSFEYDYAARNDYHCHQVFIKMRHEWF